MGSRAPRAVALLAVLALMLPACKAAENYPDPRGPRYAGVGVAGSDDDRRLRVVTFNIRYARAIDLAIQLFQTSHDVQGADIIALQEMDAPGAERIAKALGLSYVYYPGALHARGGKDFGNAILVRGVIEEDRKIVLPHYSRLSHMQRIAVVATVRVDGRRIRVYSVHLEAPGDLWPTQRLDQVTAILEDARSFPGPVIVAGDFNNRDRVGAAFEKAGYTWLSRDVKDTISMFAWDHLFVRDLPTAGARTQTTGSNGASDHRPVWTELVLSAPPAPATGARNPGD